MKEIAKKILHGPLAPILIRVGQSDLLIAGVGGEGDVVISGDFDLLLAGSVGLGMWRPGRCIFIKRERAL